MSSFFRARRCSRRRWSKDQPKEFLQNDDAKVNSILLHPASSVTLMAIIRYVYTTYCHDDYDHV